MKLTEIRWKWMNPKRMMQDISEYLGIDDTDEFLHILKTDPAKIMRSPWIGKKTLNEILNAILEDK